MKIRLGFSAALERPMPNARTGFALKFYTEDGNWDIVGNNTPVFGIVVNEFMQKAG